MGLSIREGMILAGQRHLMELEQRLDKERAMAKKKTESEASNGVVYLSEQFKAIRDLAGLALNRVHEVSVDIVSTEAKLETTRNDLKWLKEQFLEFADHKESCEIRAGAEEGRIVEGVECSCGFKELSVQFNADLYSPTRR